FLVGGLLWGPYTTVETTALQRWVHPARHGAVFGLQRSLLATATPLGAAAGALALGRLGPGAARGRVRGARRPGAGRRRPAAILVTPVCVAGRRRAPGSTGSVVRRTTR